jgi:hypothetical protein
MSVVGHEAQMGDRQTSYEVQQNTRPSQRFLYTGLILLHVSAHEQSHNQAKIYLTFNS